MVRASAAALSVWPAGLGAAQRERGASAGAPVRRGWAGTADGVGVGDEADRVSLPRHQVRERSGEQPRVLELRQPRGPRVVHRRARIERDLAQQIRRLAELLRVEPIGPREQLPVDVLEIVAGTIVAVLAELRAVAVERAAMQARDGAVDDALRDQLEIGNRRERRRVRGSRPYMRQQLPDDFVGVDAVGLGLEVHEHAVAQHRQRHGARRPRAPRPSGLRAARAPCRRAAAPARRAGRRPSAPTCARTPAPLRPAGRVARTRRAA